MFDEADFLEWCINHNKELEEIYYEFGMEYSNILWEQYAFDRYMEELRLAV